jgi:peroxiredoxin
MVTQGNIAPDFTPETDRSEKVTLSKGRSCSFYPKDDTPGWKIECKAR